MDWEYLKTLNLSKRDSFVHICEVLESHQLELMEKLRDERDFSAKEQIKAELIKVDEQIKLAKNSNNSSDAHRGNIGNQQENAKHDSQDDVAEETRKKLKDQLNKLKSEEKARRKQEKKEKSSEPVISKEDQSELQKAINEYKAQKYNEAFNKFLDLANKDVTEAKYYVAIMYLYGQGIETDNDRYGFWLKEAAKCGHIEAQYAYAKTILSSQGVTDPLFSEGLIFLGFAADQKMNEALNDYIELVLQGYNEIGALKSAIKYCDYVISNLSDQYEKHQYKEKKRKLKRMLWLYVYHIGKIALHSVIDVISWVGVVFGSAYWFVGTHIENVTGNALLQCLPPKQELLFGPLGKLWSIFAEYIDLNGQWGIESALVSSLLYQLSLGEKWYSNNKIRNVIYCILLSFFGGFFVLWHFIAQIQAGNFWSSSSFVPVALIAGTWFVGWGIGFLINKLIERI